MRPNSFSATCVTEPIPCRFCYTTHSVLSVSHDSFYFMCVPWRVCDAMGVTWVWHAPIYVMRFIWLIVPYVSDMTRSVETKRILWHVSCRTRSMSCVWHDVCDAMVVTCPVLCHVCPRTHCTWCVCDMTRSVFDVRQNAFYAIYVTELILFLVCYMTCCISCVWRDVFYVMCVTAQHTVQRISHTDWVPCVIHVRQKAFFAMCVTELILFHECDTHITHRLSSLGDRNHSNPHIRTKKSL